MLSRIRKRCPKCGSSDIYKRSRYDETKKDSNVDVKMYKCYNCNLEFDVPFVGKKEK